mgnify:CR=1 FL=1
MRTTLVIAVHPSMPAKTLAQYIAHAKANPGKLAYTSSGIGTQAHFAGMNLASMAGISLLHVPYNNARLVQDVVSGDVPSTISIVSSLTSFIKSGRLRPLAIAGLCAGVGLRRAGFTAMQRAEIKEAFDLLYRGMRRQVQRAPLQLATPGGLL